MSTLSIHPIEYLRLHTHYDEVWTRSFKPLVKKVLESSEQAATIAVVVLTVGIVIFACMKIGESALVGASYNDAIIEIVLPTLQEAIPMGL